MTNNKEKYAFWLTPEAKKMIEINAPLANCGSQSEFVEKAVRFYDGYLKVQNAGAFLHLQVAIVEPNRLLHELTLAAAVSQRRVYFYNFHFFSR